MRSDERLDEMLALGTGLYLAQKFEFALYGVAAHLTHLPEAQNDRRLKSLNGENFLRGDTQRLKVTLGQLVKIFADRLLLASSDLDTLVEDRNLIVHNYYRHFHTQFDGQDRSSDAIDFLQDFTRRVEEFLSVLQGLIMLMKEALAQREGRRYELTVTDRDKRNKEAYLQYVNKHINLKIPT